MKKILILCLSIFYAANISAITLPDGREIAVSNYEMTKDGVIKEAKLAMPVDFEIKIGSGTCTITAEKGQYVEFYENGTPKKLYTKSEIKGKIGVGNAGNLESVKLGTGNSGRLFLHETGFIKEAVIPNEAVLIDTGIGKINLKKRSRIQFYDSGEIESLVPDQHELVINKNRVSVTRGSEVAFHKNGALKTISFSSEIDFGAFNSKPNTKIEYYDSGKIKSFVPADGSILSMYDKEFILAPNAPFELYEKGAFKNIVIDCIGKDIDTGDVYASFSQTEGLKFVQIEYHENTIVKSFKVVDYSSFNGVYKKQNQFFSFFTKYNPNSIEVCHEAIFHDNGRPALVMRAKRIDYARVDMKTRSVHDSEKLLGESFVDWYDADGKARLSMIIPFDEKTGAFSYKEAIAEYDKDGKILAITEADIGYDSFFVLDDRLMPTGYTVASSRYGDETVVENLSAEVIERLRE